jgi:hypothetical protein
MQGTSAVMSLYVWNAAEKLVLSGKNLEKIYIVDLETPDSFVRVTEIT